MSKWYEKQSEEEIVISSRVRLARNVAEYHFPGRMKEKECEELVRRVRECVPGLEQKEGMKYYSCSINKLSRTEKESLKEWYIVSDLIIGKEQETALVLAEDEGISILVNEEEHLRIQSVAPGADIDGAYYRADRVDNYLEEQLSYAFDGRYGYLTTSPANVGTGMRASFLVFLPALTMAGKIQKLADEVARYGILIRGISDEGTKTQGFLYRISNQKTLGITEREILDNLKLILKQIVQQEQKYREHIGNVSAEEITDKVYRSYAVLRHAKRMAKEDATLLLAQLKFGRDMGLIAFQKNINLYELMIRIQPANLQKLCGKSMTSEERPVKRAEYLNRILKEAGLVES